MDRGRMRARRVALAVLATGVVAAAAAPAALADSYATGFEPPAFAPGDIDGQGGWLKSGPYDAAIVTNDAAAPAAFGSQSLRISNAVTSGSFGDQTFAPALAQAAHEGTATDHFEYSLSFAFEPTPPPLAQGLHLSVAPDDGQGSRMSSVSIDEKSDGIHVIVWDVPSVDPATGVADFEPHDVATVDMVHPHTLRMTMDLLKGESNDVVKLYVDGRLAFTGTSWEQYYRDDPEQAGNGNVVPDTDTILLRESGGAVPDVAHEGYLVDAVAMTSRPMTCQEDVAGGREGGPVSGPVHGLDRALAAHEPLGSTVHGANCSVVVPLGL